MKNLQGDLQKVSDKMGEGLSLTPVKAPEPIKEIIEEVESVVDTDMEKEPSPVETPIREMSPERNETVR